VRRTPYLAFALLVPLLVAGCVAVTPTAGRTARHAAPDTDRRSAVEQVVPTRGEEHLVASGPRKSPADKGRKKTDTARGTERGRGGGKAEGGSGSGVARLRAQGRGEPAARQPAPRRPAAGRAAGSRRSGPAPPRAARQKPPAVRVRPVRPRKHGGHRSTPRSGFRMGAWCRQADGVASRDVVSLCHQAYGR
jgi:hypothetical protein